MKIKYFGHSCFSLSYENGAVLATDPFDESVTYPPCAIACDAVLVSHDHFDHNHVVSLSGSFKIVRTAGEHEVKGVKLSCIESFHDKQHGALRGKNLLTRIEGEGLSIAHLGDLGHLPTEAQSAFLHDLDILMLPIGGTYTIDTAEAEALIAELKPRHVIAMHFKTEAYEINISTCDAFAADMQASFMPNEIEVTRENIASLPKVMILSYK